ncbi:hypothetical protein [Bacillus benzoevorans]|uniref:Uncharacterized protein n=1 Tax=Bacillus benzoevorans TaxID=1456 RepID=A0A7X0HQQ3_9BACI|nr:hypothetical protein [Bacillus benzoevorans]MBB6445192.1 hypothetical protein [Bacillus benzoevorans]
MPSKQLVELVHRLKNSGIKISFTTPRSKTMIHLQEAEEWQQIMTTGSLCCKKKSNNPVIDFIQPKSVRDIIIPH